MMPTMMFCSLGGKVAMSAAVLTRTWPDSTFAVSFGMPFRITCLADFMAVLPTLNLSDACSVVNPLLVEFDQLGLPTL